MTGEFKAGTGMMGSTETGQAVTPENFHTLPVGSVVTNPDGSRIVRLHDDLCLWITEHCSWLYDTMPHMIRRKLAPGATACHVAPVEHTPQEEPCVPNGFGFCSTHPTCDHVRASTEEVWRRVARLEATLKKVIALTDTGSSEHKERFAIYGVDVMPGWRVVEAIREAALEGLS